MSSPTEKRVLAQDRPQYEQSIKAARQRENKKIEQENEKAQKQYEADLKKYEAEKAAYDKQLKEYQNSAQGQFDFQTKQVTDKIKALEAQRAKDLNEAHSSVWGPGGSRNRSELASIQNEINKQYNSKINELNKQQNALSNYYNFSVAYPNQPIPTSVLRTVQRSGNQVSLIDTFERYQTGKQAKYERDVQSSVQNAVNAPRYTPQQTAAIQADHVNVLGLTGEGTIGAQERAANIKTEAQNASAVTFPFVPTMAEKTRAPLINVKTGEYDSKGRWVENNPVALVKGLTKPQVREGVTIMSEKIQGKDGSQTAYSFQGMTVTEPSAVTLIDFQQGLKTTQRVSPTIYKGILEEKGLPLTPLSKRIIDVYSTKGKYLGYEEPVQAKGKKAVYTNPLTGKSFDSQTGMGDVVIGKQLGFVFDSNMPKPENFVGKTFEGSLEYNIKPKVQGPQQPKFEEAKGFLSLEDAIVKNKPLSSSGERLEYLLTNIEKQQKKFAKYDDDAGKLLHVGLEYSKDFVAAVAFIENKLWQGEALIRGGSPKYREIQIPPTVAGGVAEDLLTGRPMSAIPNIQQYEKTYGKGSALGSFAALVTPIPTGKLQTPRFIIKTGRFVDEKLMLAEKWDMIKGRPPATHPTEGYYIGTRQERRIELAKWEKLPPSTQQSILERREFNRLIKPKIAIAEYEESIRKNKRIATQYSIPKITSEITIRQPPKILTLTQGQPYNLERDFGNASDLPRMGSKPDLRKGTSIDYNELFSRDRPSNNYHAFIGESKSIGKQFQGTRIELGSGVGSSFKRGSSTPSITPPSKPASTPTFRPKDETIVTGRGGLQLILKSPEVIKQESQFKMYPIRLEGKGSILKIKPKKKKPETKTNEAYLIKPVNTYEQVQQYETVYFPPQFKYDYKSIQTQSLVLSSPQMQKISTRLISPQMQKLETPQMQKQQLKIKQKLKTRQILKEKTKYQERQKYRQSPVLKSALVTKLTAPTLTKQITIQIPKLRTPTPPPKLRMLIPDPPRPPRRDPPRKKGGLGLPVENKIPKSVKKKQKARDDFLGHSSEIQIGGLFKRKEITYGDKKISRLLQGDVRVVKGKSRNIKRTQKQQYDMLGFKTKKGRKTKDDRFW